MDLLEGSLEGFIELLIARAKVKNDLNVNMTMIQHEENNILKHSVHAKQAMALFLQTQSDSFLAAKPAIEDTVKDIKQHQRALFEAVKKALQSTLNAVDPLAIERQASEGKRYFFPGNKYKADCWKDYSKRFQNLQRNDGALLYEQFLDYFADTYQEKTQS
ncbi:FHA domain protein [Piscirickettsia salmonis]|uniref:FHA domain protein n=2 Tax=Piscirickettsia salmonis TaxID=1238 RepID=A0AAC8VHW4_PISSA|nr:FHA domain protein [Piscirickettsia salmonis]